MPEEDRDGRFVAEQQSSNYKSVFFVGRWDGSGRHGIPYTHITITDLPEIPYCEISLVPFANIQSTMRKLFLEQEYCFDRCEQIAHDQFESMRFEREQQWRMN